jgi:[acyl-carrier-protein] S-malonyltransferase
VVAGHSLGEYSALVAAGALTLADAAPLVRFPRPGHAGSRAGGHRRDGRDPRHGCAEGGRRLRRSAAPSAPTAEVVEAVNFNDPAQTVIAGSKAAVDKACEMLKAMGAKRALLLPVSAPFHSSLMKPAADRCATSWPRPFAVAAIPGGQQHRSEGRDRPDRIRAALYRAGLRPGALGRMHPRHPGRGVGDVVECGPGKVLAGLVQAHRPAAVVRRVYDPATLAEAKGLLA